MSKEYSEALENLKQQAIAFEHSELAIKVANGNYTTLQQALQRLESIDNSTPSEALKCLEEFKGGLVRKETGEICFNQIWFKMQVDTIKQALIKSQEQEKENELLKGQMKYLTEVITDFQKMLKIIKEKDVEIKLLKECETVEDYNAHFIIDEYQELTQEEFDLLKRCLG